MDRKWNQIAVAFLMSMLMPVLAMQFGKILVTAGTQSSSQQTQTTEETYTDTPPVMIPVLLSDRSVRIMELDTYLRGVVLAEMPASFEMEALKAQAVAARTCALQCNREGTKHPAGAVCTDFKCCQAYMETTDYLADGGKVESIEKISQAVEQTSGQVITYQGELIQATYFSCSGGRTENAVAVWGTEVPYLQSVESTGEEDAEIYCNTVQFSALDFALLLGRNLNGSCSSWLGSVTRTEGGGVATMVVGGKIYTGTELRELLSLNSTAFTMSASENTISVTTYGKGHRVGMSQYGADAMATLGSTYDEILAYYYGGARIDKLDTLE